MARLPYQTTAPSRTLFNYASCIVSTFAPCAPTAAPICHCCPRRTASLVVDLRPASPVLYCTHARTHIRKSTPMTKPMRSAIYDTPCIDCRPAQPATLSVGTRQLLRALSSCIHEARTRVRTRLKPQTRGPLATKVKSLLRTSNRPSPPFCLARLRDEAEPCGSSFCHQTDTAT